MPGILVFHTFSIGLQYRNGIIQGKGKLRLDQRARSARNPWDFGILADPKSCPESPPHIPNSRMERSFPLSLFGFPLEFGIYQPEQQENSNETENSGKSGIFWWRLWLGVASQVEFQRQAESLAAAGGLDEVVPSPLPEARFLPKIPRQAQEQLQLKGFTSFIAA